MNGWGKLRFLISMLAFLFFFHGALHLQKPYGLLGMGGENGTGHASPGPPPCSHSSWPLTAFSSSLPILKAQAHQLPSRGDKRILWQGRSRLQFNNTIDWLSIQEPAATIKPLPTTSNKLTDLILILLWSLLQFFLLSAWQTRMNGVPLEALK